MPRGSKNQPGPWDNARDPRGVHHSGSFGGWGPPAGYNPWGAPARLGPTPEPKWKSRVRFLTNALTTAQQRQQAFRSRGGTVQAIRYAAGLEPMERRTLGMFRAETFQNIANPRQFESAISQQPEGLDED